MLKMLFITLASLSHDTPFLENATDKAQFCQIEANAEIDLMLITDMPRHHRELHDLCMMSGENYSICSVYRIWHQETYDKLFKDCIYKENI